MSENVNATGWWKLTYEFWDQDSDEKKDVEIDEVDRQWITECITNGCWEGMLSRERDEEITDEQDNN